MSLEIKKLKAEMARVFAARLEMEVKIEELEAAITRVKSDIDVQLKKEAELNERINKGE